MYIFWLSWFGAFWQCIYDPLENFHPKLGLDVESWMVKYFGCKCPTYIPAPALLMPCLFRVDYPQFGYKWRDPPHLTPWLCRTNISQTTDKLSKVCETSGIRCAIWLGSRSAIVKSFGSLPEASKF